MGATTVSVRTGPDAQKPLDFDDLRKRVTELKLKFEFTGARALLDRARLAYRDDVAADAEQERRYVWTTQQLALCTYKDENLHPVTRFDQALTLLEEIGLRESTNPETLGLGGALYKRRFEYSGQLDDLFQALGFYRTAWERNPEADLGYGGVNAAFVLDMLAEVADGIAYQPESFDAAACRAEAAGLREDIARRVGAWCKQNPALARNFFVVATLAEAHFGLKSFPEAGRFLAAARELDPSEWQQQTLVQQLVTLAKLQGVSLPRDDEPSSKWAPPWKALEQFLGDDMARALGCFRGKIGLALSGGGFRASLFHIGVLARIAEIDALRSVEALSTVSGGSILGAHYYLALRALQQVKPDREISRSDYIALVDNLRREFFSGVEYNIRMRTFSNLFANLRMLTSWPPGKFRTVRLGRLYERWFYSRVRDEQSGAVSRPMRRLLIAPKDEAGAGGAAFNPKFSNWRRRAKVPALILNATSLNTGHAWHFTAKWMGEPPALVGEEVDMKPRYRRPYYEEAPAQELQDLSLGLAVAASSCVPALFAPIELKGLYPDRIVRLVDGGVHDNQGVQALLVEGCNVILCSDASGQMREEADPNARELQVALRANGTLMERVRESQYQNLKGRYDSRALAGLFFVHLKKGLGVLALDWQGSAPRSKNLFPVRTDYGIARDLQTKLAAIRTDLDVFSEVEASALMLSGYLMAEHEFKKKGLRDWAAANGFDVDAARGNWEFLQIEPLIRQAPDDHDRQRADLALQLDASSERFFKALRLSPLLRTVAWMGLVLASAVLTYGLLEVWERPIRLPELVLGWALLGKLVVGTLAAVLIGVGLFTAAVNLHLALFDRIYRARGRIRRLLNQGNASRTKR